MEEPVDDGAGDDSVLASVGEAAQLEVSSAATSDAFSFRQSRGALLRALSVPWISSRALPWSDPPGGGPELAIGEGHEERHNTDDHHENGDDVQALIRDAGVKYDADRGGGGDGANVAEGAEQT